MKNLALIGVLLFLLASPCLAQSEVQGMFSIESTKWQLQPPIYAIAQPFDMEIWIDMIGFSGGIIYGGYEIAYGYYGWLPFDIASHSDLLLFCIFSFKTTGARYQGLLFSWLGFGFASGRGNLYRLTKYSDNFIPN